MAKLNFIKDLAVSHSSGHSDLNKKFNDGLGVVPRKAVTFEDKLEELDNLSTKARGQKGRFGWDRRSPAFKYSVLDRWIESQVGRHIDKVVSEAMAFANNKKNASLSVRDKIFSRYGNLNVRGSLEIREYSYFQNHSKYLAVCLVSADGKHIYDTMRKDELYVNLAGILCKVPEKIIAKCDALRAQDRKKSNRSVVKIKGRFYFCLNGAWQELSMAKSEPVRRKVISAITLRELFYTDQPRPNCLLCRKLGINWSENAWRLFDSGSLYCIGFRTLSKKEIKMLLLDTYVISA